MAGLWIFEAVACGTFVNPSRAQLSPAGPSIPSAIRTVGEHHFVCNLAVTR